jgi:hypothetical protein
MQGAVVASPQVHRPSYGSWLLSNLLGIVVGILASLPASLLYLVMVDAYIENSEGDPLTFGTAFICGALSLIAVFAGWLVYAGVIYSRMSEWTSRDLVLTVVGVQGLALSLVPINGLLGLLVIVLAFLLLPLVFMWVGDRNPGRTAPIVIGVVLAILAVAGPVIALGSEIRPF